MFQPPASNSRLPLTGAMASPNDLRVPQPRTLSGMMLPSQQAASYQNQQLGGLLSRTSGVVGGARNTPVGNSLPSLGSSVATPGSGISDSIRKSNNNLMQIAQFRQAALQRAAQAHAAQPQAASGGSGQQAPAPAQMSGGRASFEGYTGGATFARLIPLLNGYQVTDTYRDPEYNRRVGGVSTSFHMDKNNPAVDIGGSTASLNALYQKLKAMGGWRQLLWQVPGHYDHIHVA